MKSLLSFCLSALCIGFAANAQIEGQTLFQIDGQEYKVDEFITSYQKNSDIVSASSESVEKHLERYVNFHLKLKSAYAIQLDTLSSFKKEFGRYYKQIADSYISNGEVTEAMVKETYDRTKTEVRASHILLNLPKYEEDTTEVYQKALMIRKRMENGEDFETLAKQYSDDPSVQSNAGDMNWFNAFKMVYEFEDTAYKLDVGEISNPVRTDFGYHIIKKTGERLSKGQLKTAHIMVLASDSLQDAEVRIQKIYKRLEEGDDFHELAKQYSQDPNTAGDGGYVPVFSLGGLNSKVYENKAYDLEKEGDYTKPFKTRFGWHIVKLIESIPLKPYDEVKEDYKKRLKSSSRSKYLITKIKEDLESLYEVEINEDAKDHFLSLIDSSFTQGKWTYEPQKKSASRYIIKVEDRTVDYATFGAYLERQQRSFSDLPAFKVVVENAIDDLVYSELLAYHKTRLPETDKEFGDRIEGYKNGVLIFDYMKEKIWEPVAEDTLLQKKYYSANASDFKIPQKVRGQLYTSKSKKTLESLASELQSRSTNDSLFQLPEEIISEEVLLEKSSLKLPENFKFEEGLSKIYKHSDQFLMMQVNEVEKAKIPEFDQVSGEIISILQEKKERQLISELRKNYTVIINNDVLKILKDKLEN
ncbi:peptidylprolyl isomerase [Psychroflexus sediminis]|uniref:Peptidyl-prolyl cis-trans isomerase SurA n=1 Tax=Psychroflexus sediminis TaxID=470826 RepID=A0A1G7WEI6_9FLAO|nr:peptidylprolyl isomerase [Psychroflexus sediminis]SDG70356.1 peptidyl-prolyl cis-trans isomerase SurA [Psychroflexus sediminis]